jgi:hypothetical protein
MLNAGDLALGASSQRQHRFGNMWAGSARARVRLLASPAGLGPFMAEVRIITSGKRAGHACRSARAGRDGAARANLIWAGYVVTAGDVRAELDGMVAGWGGTPDEVAAEAEFLITILPAARNGTMSCSSPAAHEDQPRRRSD